MQLHQIITLPFLKATITMRVRAFPVMRRILADRQELLVDALRSPMAREYISAMRDYVNREAGDNTRLLVLVTLLEQLLALSEGLAAGFEEVGDPDVQCKPRARACWSARWRRMTHDLLMHLQHIDTDTLANWGGAPSPIGEQMSPEQFDAVRCRCVAFLLDHLDRT